MVQSSAGTIAEYIRELPDERATVARKTIAALRKAMPKGFAEGMTWGMPTWEVPLDRYPDTYNKKPLMYCAFAAQKNHYAIYLTTPYQSPEMMKRLEKGFEERGAKLDMGKSCVRFKSLDSLPIEVIQDIVGAVGVDGFIETYETARASSGR